MKNSVNGNMYNASQKNVRITAGEHLSGSAQSLVCVVSNFALVDQAKEALNKSFAALKYGDDACTFVSLINSKSSVLDAATLFMTLEGLDPLCVIICDAESKALIEQAYRLVPSDRLVQGNSRPNRLDSSGLKYHKVQRVFGRPVVVFRDFQSMLETSQDKQQAWSILKTLPTYGESA